MTDDGLLIECSGLTVAFGGVVAVNDVSFSVARGELLGLTFRTLQYRLEKFGFKKDGDEGSEEG